MPSLPKILTEDPTKVEKELTAKINRGRERLQLIAAQRDVCWEFFRGNHFSYVDDKGVLQILPTVTSTRGTGKPRWRARQSRNLIFDAVLYETSACTQRVPNYQVVPSSEEPQDRSAAAMAEKVAVFGHSKWQLRKAASDAVTHAIVGGEAFAWPYFDTTIGPFIEDVDEETGEVSHVGQGDVRVKIFGSNECYWEPGMRFEDSPWHCVEQARTLDEVRQMDGFLGVNLNPDADARELAHRGPNEGQRKLILVTDYLERPSPANPEGRWATMANGRRVVPDRPYPAEDLVLRKLCYAPDPDSDRDLGLVPQLLDAQRTHNDANNKLVEWKNLCLFPRIFAAPGVMKKQRWTDEPGKVYEVPNPKENIVVADTPTVPNELFEMADRAERDIGRIAAQNDIPSQVESGRGIQALLEKDSSRRAAFVAYLAEWYSQIMHDCLALVQEHYTEPRLLHIKGDFGWESLQDFEGAHLRDQIDVRVFPDSIEPRTKQAVETRIMQYAQLQWIGPEEAMSAIEHGTAEALTAQLVRDEARAGRIIQRIKQGTDALAAMPMIPTGRMAKEPATDPMTGEPIIDPMTGQPQMIETGEPEMAPAWMPRYSDNLVVFKSVFSDWMKTEEFENLDPELQQAAAEIFMGILQLEAEKAQEEAQIQSATAAQYGMDNAAAGPKPKPNPSLPGLEQPDPAMA